MKRQLLNCSAVIAVSISAAPVTSAAAASIVSYDIQNGAGAHLGGSQYGVCGGAFTYNGQVTASASGGFCGAPSANFYGGGGSLNDGILPTSFGSQSQIFSLFNYQQPPGQNDLRITVHLDGLYQLDYIDINNPFGNLTGLSVTAGNQSQFIDAVPLADGLTSGAFGAPLNERFQLTGPLAGRPTDSFTLSGFTLGRNFGADYVYWFDIGEISISGRSVGAVPEPSTWAMMLLGFGLVGGAMRSAKRRQKLNVSYA